MTNDLSSNVSCGVSRVCAASSSVRAAVVSDDDGSLSDVDSNRMVVEWSDPLPLLLLIGAAAKSDLEKLLMRDDEREDEKASADLPDKSSNANEYIMVERRVVGPIADY